MLSSLVFYLSLGGWHACEPAAPQPPRAPRLPARDSETYHREFLEWARHRTAGLEEMSEWMERRMKENSGVLTPETSSRIEYQLPKLRAEVQFMKKYVQELER